MYKKVFKLFLIALIIESLILFISATKKYKSENERYEDELRVYEEKVKNYENGNQKTIENVKIENVEQIIKDIDEKKFMNLYSCFISPLDENSFSIEMKSKIDEINNYFNSINTNVSFAYEDLYTGLRLSYNAEHLYFAASTIKAPVIMYAYKMSNEGLLDLDEVLTYTPAFYIGGTGSIRYQKYGNTYTIRELAKKAIIESDNIAYAMISNKIKNSDIREFWSGAGSSTFWSNNSIWGNVKSLDGIIYMRELYKFLDQNDNVRSELLDYYSNASLKLINIENTPIAHKSGWTNSSIHDAAIIYSNEPYVLSINTSLGESNFYPFFTNASKLINEFHELYWKEKQQICYNQYIN